MKSFQKNFFVIIALVCIFSILNACGNSEEEKSDKQNSSTSDDLLEVNVAVQKLGAYTNVYYAQEEGIFEENGLKANFVEVDSGPSAISAAQGGDIDLISTAPASALWARDEGFNLKMVANNEAARSEGPDSAGIVVLEDSDIEDVEDLEGRSVGTYEPRSSLSLTTKKLFKNKGMDYSTVDYRTIPFPSMGDSLRNNDVDAVMLVDPFTTEQLMQGGVRVISWNAAEGVPGQEMGSWWAFEDYIDENPEVIERFYNTLDQVDKFLTDPENETIAKEYIAEWTGLDVELLEEMPIINWTAEVDPEVTSQILDILIEFDEIDDPPEDIRETFSETVLSNLK